jgi:hypothetical protein
MAYFVVATMMLVCLQGCTILDRAAGCTPPPGEAQLLADYQSQTVWNLLPASVTDAPVWVGPFTPDIHSGSVVRYCDETIDGYYFQYTALRVVYGATGYWSSAKLLDAYGRAATASGWSLIGTGDGDAGASCGLRIEEGGVPSCMENGILFCKPINGVTTDFVVSSYSRPDMPDLKSAFDLRIFSRRDLSSCASS